MSPTPRFGHSATVYKNRFMYVYGGNGTEQTGNYGPSGLTNENALECFDATNNEWTQIPSTQNIHVHQKCHVACMRLNSFCKPYAKFKVNWKIRFEIGRAHV